MASEPLGLCESASRKPGGLTSTHSASESTRLDASDSHSQKKPGSPAAAVGTRTPAEAGPPTSRPPRTWPHASRRRRPPPHRPDAAPVSTAPPSDCLPIKECHRHDSGVAA
jgi:hypothetical protein